MQATAQIQKIMTLNAKLPASTTKMAESILSTCDVIQLLLLYLRSHSFVGPPADHLIAPTIQDKPNPRKTFTELLPVTLPIDASAYGSCVAAVFEANVSGSDVPKATKLIAVISSGMSITHPKRPAMSPITAVTSPIIANAQ